MLFFSFKVYFLKIIEKAKIFKSLVKIIIMPLIQFKTTEEEEQMIETLKPIFKTTTRTKVFKGCLKKTFELYKDLKIKKGR